MVIACMRTVSIAVVVSTQVGTSDAVKRAVHPALRRRSPWKSRSPLRPGPGGSPEPSFGRQLFGLAQASSSVPLTEKCSLDSSRLTLVLRQHRGEQLARHLAVQQRSRFLVKVV